MTTIAHYSTDYARVETGYEPTDHAADASTFVAAWIVVAALFSTLSVVVF